MGLFEWFAERHNRGPIGRIDVGPGGDDRGPVQVGPRLIVAVILLGVWLYSLWSVTTSVAAFGAGMFFTAVYLVVAYFIHPEPDTSNVGWFGGLIDHPFRYSDDINRMLVWLLILLWPGRIVANGLVDGWRVWRRHSDGSSP